MSQRPPAEDPIWALFEAVCLGSLDDGGVCELELRLKAEPGLRDLYSEYCLLHSGLRLRLSAERSIDAAWRQIQCCETFSARPPIALMNDESLPASHALDSGPGLFDCLRGPFLLSWRTCLVTVAALFLLAVVVRSITQDSPVETRQSTTQSSGGDLIPPVELAEWGKPPNERSIEVDGFVGQIVNTFQAQWEDSGPTPSEKEYLYSEQSLRLRDGLVELKLFGGGKVVLEGPAEFKVLSKNEGFLSRGRIAVSVDERVYGFQIKTPAASVIDLGARFGVQVDQNGDTQIHVFDGAVQAAVNRDGQLIPKSVRRLVDASLTVHKHDGKVTVGSADPAAFVHRISGPDDNWKADLQHCLITYYAFNDPANLSKNRGSGQDGSPEHGVSPAPGLVEGGADFGGDDLRCIEVAPEDVAAFSPGGLDGRGLTISAWVKTTCIDQRCNVVFGYDSPNDDANTSRNIVLLELEFGGLPNALVRETGREQEITLSHHQGIADGNWHHIALTLSAGNEKRLTLYVDGELSRTQSSHLVNDVKLQRARVGRRFTGEPADDNDFQGQIDEVLIFNRAVKPSDIRRLYISTKPTWT